MGKVAGIVWRFWVLEVRWAVLQERRGDGGLAARPRLSDNLEFLEVLGLRNKASRSVWHLVNRRDRALPDGVYCILVSEQWARLRNTST